jgi:hypothetical protein
MRRERFAIANIYVPAKLRADVKTTTVDAIVAAMLEGTEQTPILVRADGARFVLVEGVHRLEAAKAVGETTISGFLVQARKH